MSSWVPFPTADSGADAGGVSSNEDEQVNFEENKSKHALYMPPSEKPHIHQQAMSCPDTPFWEEAKEYKLMMINCLGTYKLVPLPLGCKAISSKWVYKVKCDMNGKIVKYHAQVVAQGFTQQPGIDFFETYAPVARIKLVCLLLALAAMLDWEIHVINIDSAFLNSGLPVGEDIYLHQPPGHVIEGEEDWVWFLIKALYGLKQASHLWYEKLKEILIKMGFLICKADPCVFIHHHSLAISFISSHVDGLGLYCSS